MLNSDSLKIGFSKITHTDYAFKLNVVEVEFSGILKRKNAKVVECRGKIKGKIPYNCDRCAKDIVLEIDESIEILISDGIFKDDSHEIIDVIECFGGEIDMNEILNSEIEAYKSDYFYCEECKNL